MLTVLGRWAWGPCQAVDAKDSYAYIGNGLTFQVLDISKPSKPEIVGEYLTDGYIYDLKIKDSLAFVCIGRGLLILDISKPMLPTKISEVSLSGVAISLAVGGTFAYITTFNGVMWLVDITDIFNPYVRSSIAAGGQLAACVEAKDRYVYIGNAELSPMVIVDATNPDSLKRFDFEVGGSGLTAKIKDSLLFLGVRGTLGNPYLSLKIYNISNASSPEFMGRVEIVAVSVNGISISKDGLTVYVLTHSNGIYSVDISNLSHPFVLNKFEKKLPIDVGNAGIALSRNSLFAAFYNGLLVLDVSELGSLKFQSFFPTGCFSEKIKVKDSITFVACGLSGLWILDVSNPEKIKTISNLNTGGFTADFVIEDTLVYIVNWAAYSEQDSSRGLWIIDISDIHNPVVLSHYIGITNFSSNIIPNSIAKSKEFIFITQAPNENNDVLEIININNLHCPTGVGILQSNYLVYDIDVKDTVAFLATYGNGVMIIDISNPENPIEIGSKLDVAFSVYIKAQYLYTSSSDFSIIDVSNPSNPIIVSSIKTHSGSSNIDLVISGNYAYWTEGVLGIIDISNPENPVQIKTFEGLDWARGVDSKNGIIFLSDQTQGVWILRNNLITDIKEVNPNISNQFELYQNYPNPFNPTTTIKFNVPKKQRITIRIFNLLGQRVRTLLDKDVEEGSHNIEFNASGLSSGIYFYQMKTREIAITKKMIVLR